MLLDTLRGKTNQAVMECEMLGWWDWYQRKRDELRYKKMMSDSLSKR